MVINSYKDLIVWQKALKLPFLLYDVTKSFPKEETYGLVSQMRRAAVSIPSNVAEGKRRGTRRDYARFIQIALGSGAELETQLEIARYTVYISESDYYQISNELTEVMKMLNALLTSLSHLQPKA